MKIRIDKTFGPFVKGTTIEVEDDNGIPYDRYWRRRLKDSETDQCCSVVKEVRKVKKVKSTKKGAS